MTIPVLNPILLLPDKDGSPLDGGYIYIGSPNQNPETSPVSVTWDEAGSIPASQPIRTSAGMPSRAGSPAIIYSSVDFSMLVKNKRGEMIFYIDDSSKFSSASQLQAFIAALANPSNDLQGDALVAVRQPYTGAADRTQHWKNAESVSVKDFLDDDIDPSNPANATLVGLAIDAAKATGKLARLTAGIWYTDREHTILGQKLVGDGKGVTTVNYTGTGTAFTVGRTGAGSAIVYNCVLGGFTLQCLNRAPTVNGVVIRNAVYSDVFDMDIIGSGSPNSATPADWVLFGAGLTETQDSFLNRIWNVNCRIWERGAWFACTAGTTFWAAATEIIGCEWSNNMYGLILGDGTNGASNGPGLNFRGCWMQGNFSQGVQLFSAQSVLFSGCYWEGNANYDVQVGNGVNLPVQVVFDTCYMDGESIGPTNYGNFPYLAKARVNKGNQITFRNCNLSITASIPLIINDAAGEATTVRDCRLNSGISALSRIQINGGSVRTSGNTPERPRLAMGNLIRNAAAAPGTVVYSGVGFAATLLRFRATIIGFGPPAPSSMGEAGNGNGVLNSCQFTLPSGAVGQSSTHCIEIQISAGNGIRGQLTVTAEGSFSIAWTQFGAPGANDIAVQWVATRDD